MLKKDTLGKASRASLEDAFKCGECLHFKQHAHSSRDNVCSKEGVRHFAIAPTCFTPDVSRICKNSDQLGVLSALLNSYSHKDRRILLALIRASTKKRRLAFGTKVYFRLGQDYLNNYLAGYVIGYTSTGQVIVSGSPDNKTRGKSYMAYLSDDTVMQTLEFKKKKRQLIELAKVHDPARKKKRTPTVTDAYEPPTMDSAPAHWFTKSEPVRKNKNGELVFVVS